MFQQLSHPSRNLRFLACASVLMLALGLGSCTSSGLSDITGSIDEKAEVSRTSDPRRDVEAYQERYRSDPKDAEAALKYGKALRASGQRAQAVAVLEQASIAHPGNRLLLAAYGRALADNGNFQQAFDVLGRAHTPDDPDWRLLSAQGATLDQLGRYEEARQYYGSALKIVPGQPSVLSNLGLSYVLSKELPKAEETLRRAYSRGGSDPRVRANLALVVGLQGNLAEAEKIARADLPPAEAAANVAQLKRMLARKDRENARADADKMPIAAAGRSD
ncbi:tetratricopeptide repeat protein [Bradyrhizobium sp.]|uniref:tetratricopeptide repeat protein n=1 Tax=Bradyrhizobium sp. TaxID=376 RepID=UPI002BC182DC|nr:tetratricopeptide repeat protein [Bradyrhizobium sp.]HMM88428.1 tetratricopeptide repeat protein [Bradyrhizobium sp.]